MTLMTDALEPTRFDSDDDDAMRGGVYTRAVSVAVRLGAIGLGALTWLPGGSVNWARWIVVSLLAYMLLTYVVARRVESKRQATDRLAGRYCHRNACGRVG